MISRCACGTVINNFVDAAANFLILFYLVFFLSIFFSFFICGSSLTLHNFFFIIIFVLLNHLWNDLIKQFNLNNFALLVVLTIFNYLSLIGTSKLWRQSPLNYSDEKKNYFTFYSLDLFDSFFYVSINSLLDPVSKRKIIFFFVNHFYALF